MKIYDVNFTLEDDACITIEANSKKEAREKAEDLLCNLSKEEIIVRLLDAVAYGGFKIKNIEYVDEEDND